MLATWSGAVESCVNEKDATTAEVQFAEEPDLKVKGRLDPAVWGALSDLEKVRWPSEPQHAPLEKKLLRAERLLTGCLLPGSAPVLEKTVATLRICSKKFLLR